MTIIGGLQFEGKTYLAWDSWIGGIEKTLRNKYNNTKYREFSNGIKFVMCGYCGIGRVFEQQFVMPSQDKEQDDYSYMLDIAYAYKKFCEEQNTDTKDDYVSQNEYIMYFNNKLYYLDYAYTITEISDVYYSGIGQYQAITVDYLLNVALNTKTLSQLDIFKLAIQSACDVNSECDRPYFIYNVTDNILEEYK